MKTDKMILSDAIEKYIESQILIRRLKRIIMLLIAIIVILIGMVVIM